MRQPWPLLDGCPTYAALLRGKANQCVLSLAVALASSRHDPLEEHFAAGVLAVTHSDGEKSVRCPAPHELKNRTSSKLDGRETLRYD
jgi:hypothetical protein